MKKALCLLSAILICLPFFSMAQHEQHAAASKLNADSVIGWLQKGNAEFVKNHFNTHAIEPQLRMTLSKEQHPKAVILTCSDSRVPPELIFNASLGDLFVIRVAGNISDNAVIGSIEYAAEHLNTPLVVIMGHTSCGAITAAVNDLKENANATTAVNDHIRELTGKIEEAVAFVKESSSADPISNAMIANIKYTTTLLRSNHPTLSRLVEKKELKVVGAYYNLDNGKVEWLNY